MHVVFRESHGLDETQTPTDLRQASSDLVVLSFSDSDLGAFAAGWHRGAGALPSLRLANLAALKHPLSVDTYVERTLDGAKGILVRLIGGVPYWAYGLAQVEALARRRGIALAVLPADGRPDPRLDAVSTLPVSTLRRLAALCDAGGAVAAQAALAQLALAAGLYAGPVAGAKALPEVGAWTPELGVCCPLATKDERRPLALVTFYRAYLTAADLGPVEALFGALRQRGFAVAGLFAPSLKAPGAAGWVARWVRELAPVAVVNATAFSARDGGASPLDAAGVPVIQVALATSTERAWEEAERGLSPADLAMHVVLPEVDGRVFAGVASFKEPAARDEALQFARTEHRPHPGRIAAIADRVAAWARLAALAPGARRVALVLSTYPGKPWQMAHAVGLDALASAEAILGDLGAAGYAVEGGSLLAEDLQQAARSATTEDDAAAGGPRWPPKHSRDTSVGPAVARDGSSLAEELQNPARSAVTAGDAGDRGSRLAAEVSRETSGGTTAAQGEASTDTAGGTGGAIGGAADGAPRADLADATTALREPWRSHAQVSGSQAGAADRGAAHLDWPLAEYRAALARLPERLQSDLAAAWGAPEDDPACRNGAFRFAGVRRGAALVALQPERGTPEVRADEYHDLRRVPRHGYVAFYLWLRGQADALVHIGAHGTLEWLPGKAVALSDACWPEALTGCLPVVYPFIVNDPGEAAQAKRRIGAVTLGHVPPPMRTGGTPERLMRLEALLDEFSNADGLDPQRRDRLMGDIRDEARSAGVEADLGLDATAYPAEAITRIDRFVCDVKESQFGDGLHVWGRMPGTAPDGAGFAEEARVTPGTRDGASVRILEASESWRGRRGGNLPDARKTEGPDPCANAPREQDAPSGGRSAGRSALDRARPFGELSPRRRRDDATLPQESPAAPPLGPGPRASAPVRALDPAEAAEWAVDDPSTSPRDGASQDATAGAMTVALGRRGLDAPGGRPPSGEAPEPETLAASVAAEAQALLAALDGRRIEAGPSGSPYRGRRDVLPTGRNLYTTDPRAVPTRAAQAQGVRLADEFVRRHLQDEGDWPRGVIVDLWGSATMRTAGEEFAMALALLGARPLWDAGSERVSGVEILPIAELDRPRIDVTLRVSGLFRDVFPGLSALFNQAVRALAQRDEAAEWSPYAGRAAAPRVYGPAPGSYGLGLGDAAEDYTEVGRRAAGEAWLAASAWAMDGEGATRDPEGLAARVAEADSFVHLQDLAETDLLLAADYAGHEAGFAAAKAVAGGRAALWHVDNSDPARPRARSLREEVARVVRARAANPGWIAGMRRHGFRGAAEIAATLDHLATFAHLAGVVEPHLFDLYHDATLGDPEVESFLADANPEALEAMRSRFAALHAAGLWRTRRNSILASLEGGR